MLLASRVNWKELRQPDIYASTIPSLVRFLHMFFGLLTLYLHPYGSFSAGRGKCPLNILFIGPRYTWGPSDDDDDDDARRWSLGHGRAIPSLMAPICFLGHASNFDTGFLINADHDPHHQHHHHHTYVYHIITMLWRGFLQKRRSPFLSSSSS